MRISELVGASVVDDWLLPAVVVPPLLSLVAPVATTTLVEAFDVGVPETVQEIEPPIATVAGVAGVQAPTVTPAGRPETAHVAFSAAVVAVALLVHLIVPEYGTPTVIAVGKADRSGAMSAASVVIAGDALLLPEVVVPPLLSLTAPVATDAVVAPAAVGVPEIGHEIEAPMASDATGKAGVHAPTVTPGGKPEIAQVGFVAAAVAELLFVHTTVPAYGTPSVALAGNPVMSGLMSEPVTAIVVAAVSFVALRSFDAPVVPPIAALVTGVVGVPDTVHVIDAPAASGVLVGTVGVHDVVRPAGRPVTAQPALIAAAAGEAAFVHLNVLE
jgi:hypothetical protein